MGTLDELHKRRDEEERREADFRGKLSRALKTILKPEFDKANALLQRRGLNPEMQEGAPIDGTALDGARSSVISLSFDMPGDRRGRAQIFIVASMPHLVLYASEPDSSSAALSLLQGSSAKPMRKYNLNLVMTSGPAVLQLINMVKNEIQGHPGDVHLAADDLNNELGRIIGNMIGT